MKFKTPGLRSTAVLLSFALIQVSFGPEAWAQVLPRVGAVTTAVGGASAAAGSIRAGGFASPPPSSRLGAFSIGPAPTASAVSFSAPSAAPALPKSAIAAAVPKTAAASAPAEAGGAEIEPPAETPLAAPAEAAASPESAAAAPARGRVAARIAELRSFFPGRRDDSPAPPVPESPEATRRMLKRYVSASNCTTAGGEMLTSASMPIYLDQTFHKISLMADLSIVGSFASIVGRQLSPLIVNSVPLRKSYVGFLAAASVVAAAVGLLANIHALTILPLFGLMIAFRMIQASSATAERMVIPSALGKDQVAMERLRGAKQSRAEVASVLTQNGAAALVVLLGTATRNLLIAPFFYLAAVGLLWRSLKLPKSSDDARLAAWSARAPAAGRNVFRNFARQIATGYRVVMSDGALRASAMITVLMVLFNVLTYSILGPTFGKFAVGAGSNAGHAAPVMGLVVGLFSFGGLFAGKLVARQSHDIEARHGAGTPAAEEAARASTMRWLKFGALSFLAVGAMALPLPVVGPLIHLGGHAGLAVTAVLGAGTVLSLWRPKLGLALALIPVLLTFPSRVVLTAVSFLAFGMLQVVAALKNDSLFDRLVQEKAPADYANAAAFVGAFSMLAGMTGLTALKFLIYGTLPFGIPSPVPAFSGLPGIWPFVAIFAGLAVPAMVGALRFARRLDRLTRP